MQICKHWKLFFFKLNCIHVLIQILGVYFIHVPITSSESNLEAFMLMTMEKDVLYKIDKIIKISSQLLEKHIIIEQTYSY